VKFAPRARAERHDRLLVRLALLSYWIRVSELRSQAVASILHDNLGYFLREQPHATSERTALIDLWGGRERVWSYRRLDERMESVGCFLQSIGLKSGDRIGLLVGNRGEFAEIFFGAMRAGVVPVSLNTKQAPAMLEVMIRDAGCAAAVVDTVAAPEAVTLIDGLSDLRKIALGAAPAGWIDYESGLASAPAKLLASVSPDGIAFQAYTAGSTGQPKGVRLTHRGMLWSIRSTQENWPTPPSEIGLLAVPLFHKNAMRGTIKPVLYGGGTVVIMPRFEPTAFLEALSRYRVTFTAGVPAIFAMLLQHRDLIERLDFSALKVLSVGSAIVPQEMIDALERVFKDVKVKEAYGLTEAGGPLRPPPGNASVPRGSCGATTPGYDVKLVAADGRSDVSEGELWTRNPCVTDGYQNLPELTREKIVDGWLRTGDIFRVDAAGFYYFVGRVDDMFSCGGENLYPKEVENMLFAHPDIRDVCVAPIAHDVKGLVPAAAVVLQPGARATAEELKAFCLKHGPAYAHPRRIMVVDELPMSGAGKPDRKAVQLQLAAYAADAG
jgi:acyl-CoA synthetase (AMP-forming)/AMP-acid ligase II